MDWKYFFFIHLMGFFGCLLFAHCQSAQKIAWSTFEKVSELTTWR